MIPTAPNVPTSAAVIDVDGPDDLGPAVVRLVARGEAVPRLTPDLLDRLAVNRAAVLSALADAGPVYGVTTGMGAQSGHALGAEAQATHQHRILLARAAGGPPWLEPEEVRATLAVRLATLLHPEAAIGPQLCDLIVRFLTDGVLPAVPRNGQGVAGEIIALAHLAAPLAGGGELLPGSAPAPRSVTLGPKEGVALIEGVPVATALAILRAGEVRDLLRHARTVVGLEFALTGASRDCLHPALARADDLHGITLAGLRSVSGEEPAPRALQPPVSFRVSPTVLTQVTRAADALDTAVARALAGVTDSPAFLDGAFVGTAGFGGYDLASHLQALTVAVVGAAEVAATRLHRLMDPAVTGLGRQLSPEPGVETGLSTVHKRAVGVVHALRRSALPATVGTIEASAGQEDVQSFALEAAETLRGSLDGWLDVVACELLALHQMRALGARLPQGTGPEGVRLLDAVARLVPGGTTDRPWGRDVETLRAHLRP